MVKIRLRRMGNKHRPFYRIVVAKSTASRNGAFKELIGTYDPLTQPKKVKIDGERAMYWLMEGAQPTETVARLLKSEGVLGEFFKKRPKAIEKYKFLDKRTGTMSKESVVQEMPVATAEEPPVIEAPVSEPEVETAPAEVAPAEAPAEASAEAAPAEETPAEATPEAPPVEEKPAE